MSDRPMGFGPSDPDDQGRDDEGRDDGPADGDPFAAMFAGGDPEAMAQALRAAGAGDVDADQVRAMMGQVQRMLNTPGDGGPVNWQIAGEVARQVVSEHGDASVSEAERRAVDEALRLADTWLTDATTLPAAGARSLAWSRAEWVEGTKPVWRRLVEPVAESVARAMSDALSKQVPPELAGPLAATGPGGAGAGLMRQIGGSVFGMQVGQAVGTLSTEVVSGTEIGLPLVESGAVVLIPSGVAAFGEGLDVPADEVRLYLAVREAARSRLFAHVPWLSSSLLGAVEEYARGITIDTERIESALRETDPSDPASMQQALSSGLFEPERTPLQQAALDRLETSLALLEGWVEVVTDAAASALPHADGLRETVRRRRAIGGPAEQTFSALVGLELRPRRLRDAAALWRVIGDASGVEARDAVWLHPDLMPTAADLDDPMGYAERRAEAAAESADVDAAIERLLSDQPDES
ncbi:zinc-dependent metalloprotease [Angustibacter sp. McL0619]|uniref:zinc-dependent metalloprotease n=1 Tax=Angustibacter sp. McL0619 TaxID=3415676 RepID=UPI003CEF623E